MTAEQQAARKKLAEERKAAKAAEEEATRKRNAAVRAKLAAQGGRDAKGLDADVQAKRAKLAAERKERKEREKAEEAARKREMRRRFKAAQEGKTVVTRGTSETKPAGGSPSHSGRSRLGAAGARVLGQ